MDDDQDEGRGNALDLPSPSSPSATELSGTLEHPGRLRGHLPFSPAPVSGLVEIVRDSANSVILLPAVRIEHRPAASRRRQADGLRVGGPEVTASILSEPSLPVLISGRVRSAPAGRRLAMLVEEAKASGNESWHLSHGESAVGRCRAWRAVVL
jgi:hypothetical protein